jgi:hypothetical protein
VGQSAWWVHSSIWISVAYVITDDEDMVRPQTKVLLKALREPTLSDRRSNTHSSQAPI